MKSVGENIAAENANWSFSGDVPKKFDSHVSKSVPFYREGQELIVRLSDFFLSQGSVIYDLGCATGQVSFLLGDHNRNKNVRVIGVDSVDGMVEQAKTKCRQIPGAEFLVSDLMDVNFEKADLIVSYYTMQFVKPKNRQIIFNRIYESLNWGGAFVLFEKVRAKDARFQDIATALYTDYKLDQGYNSDEIVTKSRSLKGVLEPFSSQGNQDLLSRAGFVDVMTVMKYVCFEGFLAIK